MADKSKSKILIIEDEETLCEMYRIKFRGEGFEVSTAKDGMEGLKLAKENKPSVILLDIILPKLDGFTVLKKIKEDAALKNIPVILLTNLGQEEDVKKGMKLGAGDYLVKADYTPAQVAEKVKKFL